MRALTRKLLRDLFAMRGQALAIALVVAAGVSVFVSMMSVYDSLMLSRSSFYEERRFADVFARANRAPAAMGARLAEIPGVARVVARVSAEVTLDLPGIAEPITGRVHALVPGRDPELNALHVRTGRLPAPGRSAEVVVNEAFAKARSLRLGDRVGALINGRRQELTITGIVLSPEYVDTVGAGQLVPDDARFGVLWLAEEPLAAALDMRGVANDFAIALAKGASEADVIDAVDRALAPYGGAGAFGRARHPSDYLLMEKLRGVKTSATIIPAIFLSVAAFLLNVVLSRMVALERTQIATLRAFGYTPGEIARHYVRFALVLAFAGTALGVALGAALGRGLLSIYADFYYFPFAPLTITPRTIAIAVTVTVVAAAGGALAAVRRAAREPPAEAMKPEPPARYTRTLIERIGVGAWLSPAARMVLRNMARRPVRAALSIVGMAFAAAILVVGTFTVDAMRFAFDIQFSAAQGEDATIQFVKAIPDGAVNDVAHLPGVLRVEPLRGVGVVLRSGTRTRHGAILGMRRDGDLRRLVDERHVVHPIPASGLVLGRMLADKLGVGRGDYVSVEPIEGDRTPRDVAVATVVDEVIGGGGAYMDLDALRRLLGEGGVVTGALVVLDRRDESAFYERTKHVPAVASVAMRRAQGELFERMIAQNMGVMRTIEIIMAAIIAFAVVYNNARIALGERSRELASLRVLGFSRGEVARILLGEMAVATSAAIPLGLLLGYGMAAGIVSAYATELMRIPLLVSGSTYAIASLTVAVSAALSALIVRRRIDHLDLVGVLKTRD
ncbi:MAG: FtsX-like permease family protein [Minicystis sp.]